MAWNYCRLTKVPRFHLAKLPVVPSCNEAIPIIVRVVGMFSSRWMLNGQCDFDALAAFGCVQMFSQMVAARR
jgi:hypothetical protein